VAGRVTFYLNGSVSTSTTLDDDGQQSIDTWKHAVETGEHTLIIVDDGRNAFAVSTAAIQMITLDRQ
jgi:hypothetical protein